MEYAGYDEGTTGRKQFVSNFTCLQIKDNVIIITTTVQTAGTTTAKISGLFA